MESFNSKCKLELLEASEITFLGWYDFYLEFSLEFDFFKSFTVLL